MKDLSSQNNYSAQIILPCCILSHKTQFNSKLFSAIIISHKTQFNSKLFSAIYQLVLFWSVLSELEAGFGLPFYDIEAVLVESGYGAPFQ